LQAMMQTVDVSLGDRSYAIRVGAGTLDRLGAAVGSVVRPGRAVVVTNPAVGSLYGEPVVDSLRSAGFEAVTVEVPAGEEHKTLRSLELLYGRFLAAGLDRGSLVVALGAESSVISPDSRPPRS